MALAQPPAVQSSQPSPTLELCRVDVSPCLREINLAPAEEVTLGLFLKIPESSAILSEHALVAWHFRLKVEGSNAVAFPDMEARGMPFREQGRPQAALAGLSLLDPGSGENPDAGRYYRIKNSYSQRHRRLDYAITIVASEAGKQEPPGPRLDAGRRVLLATLTLRGENYGSARLALDATERITSRLVTLSPVGELIAADLTPQDSLALVNVRPDAEKIRLEGQVWSDVPDGQESHKPFTRPFRIEVWEKHSKPGWQGGTDLPLAAFTNLQADSRGFFTLRDFRLSLIPQGTYDLRIMGQGTLSHLHKNLKIEVPNRQPGGSPQLIRLILGPLASGDLDGNNVVNDSDLWELASSFGREAHRAETGALADFNNDGVVDGQDFSLMAANYGRRGE